jgi:nucleotide-binding universal stress UspA family protein
MHFNRVSAAMFRSILACSDGSESSERAVQSAAELASNAGSHLHVVIVRNEDSNQIGDGATAMMWSNPDIDLKDAMDTAMRIASTAGVDISTHSPQGDAAASIVQIAREVNADLIVVGNRGLRSRFAADSVPGRLAIHSPCSLLIVRTL